MRGPAILVIAMACLLSGGCFQKHRKLVLPPPAPVVAKPNPQPQIETPPPIRPQVAVLDIEPFALSPNPPIANENPPAPPAPRRRTPTTPAAGTPGAGEPHPATPEEATPSTPVAPTPAAPQLSEILTNDRRQQYEGELAGYETRAREVVNRLARQRLNGRQQGTLDRIRTFLKQAEEAKVKDIVTAVQLAKRADLLAQDLLRSLR